MVVVGGRSEPMKEGHTPFTFLSMVFVVQPPILNWLMNRCPFLSTFYFQDLFFTT